MCKSTDCGNQSPPQFVTARTRSANNAVDWVKHTALGLQSLLYLILYMSTFTLLFRNNVLKLAWTFSRLQLNNLHVNDPRCRSINFFAICEWFLSSPYFQIKVHFLNIFLSSLVNEKLNHKFTGLTSLGKYQNKVSGLFRVSRTHQGNGLKKTLEKLSFF